MFGAFILLIHCTSITAHLTLLPRKADTIVRQSDQSESRNESADVRCHAPFNVSTLP